MNNPSTSLFAAAKPARDAALGLGRLGFHLAIDLVHLLESTGLDVLCICLCLSLGLGVLGLCLLDLFILQLSAIHGVVDLV